MTGVFEALGDATRRRVLEVLSAGEQSAGDVVNMTILRIEHRLEREQLIERRAEGIDVRAMID